MTLSPISPCLYRFYQVPPFPAYFIMFFPKLQIICLAKNAKKYFLHHFYCQILKKY